MSKKVARFVYTAFSTLNSQSLVIRMLAMPQGQGGHLSHGRFISWFQGGTEEGQSVPLAPGLFLWSIGFKVINRLLWRIFGWLVLDPTSVSLSYYTLLSDYVL